MRVKFDGEDGSGPGVNRGFFASLSNELKSTDVGKNPLSKLGLFFHQPGKQPEQSGLFAPHPFMPHLVSSPSRTSMVKVRERGRERERAASDISLSFAGSEERCVCGHRQVLWPVSVVPLHHPLHGLQARGKGPPGQVRMYVCTSHQENMYVCTSHQ